VIATRSREGWFPSAIVQVSLWNHPGAHSLDVLPRLTQEGVPVTC